MLKKTVYICSRCAQSFHSEEECLKHEKEAHKIDKRLRVMYCYGDVWLDQKTGELDFNYSESYTEGAVSEDGTITTDAGDTLPETKLNHPNVSVSDGGAGLALCLEGFFNVDESDNEADALDKVADIFDIAAYQRADRLAKVMTAIRGELRTKIGNSETRKALLGKLKEKLEESKCEK